MTTTTFDTLDYFEKLKKAGFSEIQAKVQVEGLKAQAAEFRQAIKEHDSEKRQELATKGDIHDVRLEMQKMKYDLLKWQLGIALALAAIMAKGFGWLGF